MDTQFANVQSKLVTLGALYSKSERFFPVEYLAFILEQRACEKKWRLTSVHRLLKEMGVATVSLFTIYDKMFKQKVGVLYDVGSHGITVDILTGFVLVVSWCSSACASLSLLNFDGLCGDSIYSQCL